MKEETFEKATALHQKLYRLEEMLTDAENNEIFLDWATLGKHFPKLLEKARDIAVAGIREELAKVRKEFEEL